MRLRRHRDFRTGLVIGVVILVPVLLLVGFFGQPVFFVPVLKILLELVLISVPLGRIALSRPRLPNTPCLTALFDRPPPTSV
jgi:hypothetical protein